MEGAGPMVTSARFDELRRWNFGRRAFRSPVPPAALLKEIARYDSADALAVAKRVRAEVNVETMLDAWLALYREVIEEQRAATSDWLAESRAAAVGLRWLMPYYREITQKGERIAELHRLLARENSQLRQLHQLQQEWRLDKAQQRSEIRDLQQQLAQQQRFTSLCRSLSGRIARKMLKVVSFPLRAAGL
jgi:hypothetical protein